MKFVKFPHIDQFRQVLKDLLYYKEHDVDFPDVVEFVGTVKLHGTNAGVVLDRDGVLTTQARRSTITVDKDNAGFAGFISEPTVTNFLTTKLRYILEQNPDAQGVALFGEFAGKTIQKGVAICQLDKFFAPFAIALVFKNDTDNVEDEFVKQFLSADYLKDFENSDLRIFPVTMAQTFSIKVDLTDNVQVANVVEQMIDITNKVEEECPFAKLFDISGVGEGVVYHANCQNKHFIFKVKGEKHSVSKVKKLASVNPEVVKAVNDFIDYAVTENRLQQGLEVVAADNNVDQNDLEFNHISGFVKFMVADIMREEVDTIKSNNLPEKDVISQIKAKSSKFYRDFMQNKP